MENEKLNANQGVDKIILTSNSNNTEKWFLVVFIVGLGCFIPTLVIWRTSEANIMNYVWGLGFPFLTCMGLFLLYLNISAYSDKFALNKLIEKNYGLQKIISKNKENIEQSVFYNLQKLEEYYEININQAKKSYITSLFAIITGSLLLAIGIILYFVKQNQLIIPVLTTISGLVIQIISGGYFFLYQKSLQQLNFFYSQLIKNQNTMLGIELTKNIDTKNQNEIEMKKLIIKYLMENKPIDDMTNQLNNDISKSKID